jgi:hypothetical protein
MDLVTKIPRISLVFISPFYLLIHEVHTEYLNFMHAQYYLSILAKSIGKCVFRETKKLHIVWLELCILTCLVVYLAIPAWLGLCMCS